MFLSMPYFVTPSLFQFSTYHNEQIIVIMTIRAHLPEGGHLKAQSHICDARAHIEN